MHSLAFLTIMVATFLYGRTYAVDCDAAPEPSDGIDCCNIPPLVNKDFHEECATEVGGLSTGGFNMTRECIMTECIFNKYGIIKDSDVVDTNAMKDGVKHKLESHEEWQNVFNAAVDTCVSEGVAKEDELKNEYDEFKNCNPSYMYIVACIGKHLMVECPEADRGGDADKCDNLRSYFKECPTQFPPQFIE